MPTWTAAGRCMSSAGRLKKLKYAWKELGLETGSLLSPTDQGVRNPSLNYSHVEICHIIYWQFFFPWQLVFHILTFHLHGSTPQESGLRAQNMIIILGSIVNVIGGTCMII